MSTQPIKRCSWLKITSTITNAAISATKNQKPGIPKTSGRWVGYRAIMLV